MATATLSIKDKEDGTGVAYEIQLTPVPKTQAEMTLAQKIGLTAFDAIESMLKKYGATIKKHNTMEEATNAQTPRRV